MYLTSRGLTEVSCVLRSGAYTFQITITKTYGVTNLFEDFKVLYKIAGLKGQQVRASIAIVRLQTANRCLNRYVFGQRSIS